jgi:hypothetical protein
MSTPAFEQHRQHDVRTTSADASQTTSRSAGARRDQPQRARPAATAQSGAVSQADGAA